MSRDPALVKRQVHLFLLKMAPECFRITKTINNKNKYLRFQMIDFLASQFVIKVLIIL